MQAPVPATNFSIPLYGPGECPNTLAWSYKENQCLLECIFPLYSDAQLNSLFIIDRTFSVIGFLLCYLYCITTLFRPIMQKFPNSNAFFLQLSLMLMYCASFFPFFLGPRYVFCDDNTTPGSDNWACVLSGICFYYGLTSGFTWFAMFHVTITARIYLIKLPKITPYVFFFISFGSWTLVSLIVGMSLGYNAYFPGFPACTIEANSTFTYSVQVPAFYIMSAITFICCVLISVRLIKIKKKTKVSWRTILGKQFRLFAYWGHYALFVVFNTILLIESTDARNFDFLIEKVNEYILCVLVLGDDKDCPFDVPRPNFVLILIFHIIVATFPITTFIVFGARKELLLFWKEYFVATWKNKKIYLAFDASFDPRTISSNTTVQNLEDVEAEQKNRINEL